MNQQTSIRPQQAAVAETHGPRGNRGPYSGYYGSLPQEPDTELTSVLPGTPGGEYLRRFWQPVALVSQVGDAAINVTLLGEELILFRSGAGKLGLLHKHCVHRRASLEFGRIEADGIRCCYHGWKFGTDGSILETPAEPVASTLRERLWQGAYPVHEFAGIVFAYLGPPDRVPDFPILDNFLIEGTIIPYAHPYPCNWLQVAENSFDSTHVAFLHILHSKPQFTVNGGIIPTMNFYKRKIGLYHGQVRRVGDNLWISSKDILFPNVTQAGTVFSVDGKDTRYFSRSTFTRWVVPHTDYSTTVFGIAHYNDRSDPYRPEYATKEHLQVLEAGTPIDRPYEERRRYPGDVEAIGSQGPVTIHAAEHLAATDEGVALYRRRLRKAIRNLKSGIEPPAQTDEGNDPIRTYGGCSVLRIPETADRKSEAFLKQIVDEVVGIYTEGNAVEPARRYEFTEDRLRALESRYS